MDAQVREQLEMQISAIARDCPAPMLPTAEPLADVVLVEEDGALALREPFGRWLLAQRDRGDWIDDLATAARADRGFPKNGTPKDVGDRMQILGADADAFEQLEDAERVWSSL